MANIVVLVKPTSLDLQTLASTTREVLPLLKSSRKGARNSQLQVQVAKYVEAIKLTISAANSGHTVADDILDLAKALQYGLGKSEVEDYVTGMLKLATKSREDANRSLEAFRNIRQEILKVQEAEMRKSQFKDLEPTLNKFIEHVNTFITWWDWVTIQTSVQPGASNRTSVQSVGNQTLEFHLEALRDKATVERWKELQRSFVRYNQMICELQDSDPDFFHPPVVSERSYLNSLLEMLKNAGFKLIKALRH